MENLRQNNAQILPFFSQEAQSIHEEEWPTPNTACLILSHTPSPGPGSSRPAGLGTDNADDNGNGLPPLKPYLYHGFPTIHEA
jgi:hypothetical protein